MSGGMECLKDVKLSRSLSLSFLDSPSISFSVCLGVVLFSVTTCLSVCLQSSVD